MRITMSVPERIAREAERLAREEGTAIAEFCARAVEEYVKTESQQRAIDQINALLESPGSELFGPPGTIRERPS
jgi:metal-responsive CopG/Arc/MetJ family transcriptional regulator